MSGGSGIELNSPVWLLIAGEGDETKGIPSGGIWPAHLEKDNMDGTGDVKVDGNPPEMGEENRVSTIEIIAGLTTALCPPDVSWCGLLLF